MWEKVKFFFEIYSSVSVVPNSQSSHEVVIVLLQNHEINDISFCTVSSALFKHAWILFVTGFTGKSENIYPSNSLAESNITAVTKSRKDA